MHYLVANWLNFKLEEKYGGLRLYYETNLEDAFMLNLIGDWVENRIFLMEWRERKQDTVYKR